MLDEVAAASCLLACLACFFVANLHNVLRARGGARTGKSDAEVIRPSGLFVGLATVGTLVYYAAAFAYLLLAFSGAIIELYRFPHHFHPPPTVHMQIPGLILTVAGYGLFIWSVVARGKHAVSWQMPDDHRLVTWGPYRYVRHPSYLGYFLMFLGLFLIWPNFLTALSLVAIPGYQRLTSDEEELLVQRFGDQYVEYREKTGPFIPKLR